MRMHQKLLFIVLFLSMGVQAARQDASPSLNSRCRYNIVTPHNGTGVIFDESCSVAYVQPPEMGRAEITSLAETTNLQFCPAVRQAGEMANRTFASMNILSEKVHQMILSFEPLDKALMDLKVDVDTAKAKMESAKELYESAETKLDALGEIVVEVRRDYEKCAKSHSADDSSCIVLKNSWDEAKDDMKEYYDNEYEDLRTKFRYSSEDFKILSARYLAQRNRYTEAVAPLLELQDRVVEVNNKIFDLYREYAKLDGATAQIIWTIQWDRLLEDYRQANPGLRLNWTRLPIKEAELTTTVQMEGDNSNLGNVSAIRSAIILGAKPSGSLGMGKGNKVIGPQLEPSAPGQASVLFGNSASGQIVLTLAGACPYFDGINDPIDRNVNGLANHILANLVYTYEVMVRRGYTARHNLSQLLHKFEEKSRRGGFFSTHNIHRLVEDSNSSDWFSIKFGTNSAEFQYSAAEQKQIEQEVKSELIDRAIEQFAVLNAGQAIPPIVPEFIDSGATAGANALRRCYHYYCQAGSAILGTANSIWGRSDATLNFHRNNNVWISEEVNGTQFVNRSSSLGFKSE